MVSLRVIGRGVAHRDRSAADLPPHDAPRTTGSVRPPAERRVYFGPGPGWLSTPVVDRPALVAAGSIAGPLIVEEYDSTTVVPPGWRAASGDHGCMDLEAE